MKFNDESFVNEFATFVNELDVKTALEVGCSSDELINGLKGTKMTVEGFKCKGDIQSIQHKKVCDIVFSSGLLQRFPIAEIPKIIKKLASLSGKYVLNYAPNKECVSYQKAKAKTRASWKDELDFDLSSFEELHKKAGLEIVKSGFAGAEWAKRFGSETSEPYLVFVLAKIPEVKKESHPKSANMRTKKSTKTSSPKKTNP